MTDNSSNKLKYAFDLGTNSIGWAIYKLDEKNEPIEIVKTGVRIFSDSRNPKDGTSLAVARRTARGMRRRRDRFIRRKKALMKKLIQLELMPSNSQDRHNLKNLPVYELRSKAINEQIQPYELGRILYHLNQRRGFQSNRKENKKEETGKIKPKIADLKKYLNQEITLGEYLYNLHQKKIRLRFTGESEFYPDRALYKEEFERIITKQKGFHPQIKNEDWKKLEDIIFYQRPLKSKKDTIGLCEIHTTEKRAPRASLYFQRYRLLQSLANLKMIDDKGLTSEITIEDKQSLYKELSFKEKMTFDQIRKKLRVGKEIGFNLESTKNKHILGDKTSKKLKDIIKEDFSFEVLDQIITVLAGDEEDYEVREQLKDRGIPEHYYDDLLNLEIEEGHCYLSKKALQYLVPELEKQFCSPEILILGLKGENVKEDTLDQLKYYGEVLPASVTGGDKAKDKEKNESGYFGKISNPTVHVCLNQLRKITNELISEYGKPASISLEVTRDLKKNKKERNEIEKIQKKNQDENEKIKKELIEHFDISSPSRDQILKFRLWKELGYEDVNDRKCPYSLKTISASSLFSSEVEIEHILPFSKTLDDSIANKTLAYKSTNNTKKNQSPFEAFGNGKSWEDIWLNAQKFPPNKKWRFLPDAMERFTKDSGFIARQLNDTAYIAKTSKKYLETVCNQVDTIPGKLTALVRHQLGLNTILNNDNIKQRDNHKHHAVDALTIGIISRSFLQQIARLSENARNEIKIEEPFPNFRNLAQKSIEEIVVSRKEDHGIESRLHEETYYGIISPNDYEKEKGFNIVTRKDLSSLKEKDIDTVRSLEIRKKFEANGFDFALQQLKDAGTKKLRLLKKDKSILSVFHPQPHSLHEKGIIPGDNHSLEMWKVPAHLDRVTGIQKAESFQIQVYNFYERAKKTLKRPHPAATKVFTLHKGDNIIMKENDNLIIMRVKTIKPSNGLIGIVPIDSSTGTDKEAKWPTFNSFVSKEIRPIKITPSGKILDSGNPYV